MPSFWIGTDGNGASAWFWNLHLPNDNTAKTLVSSSVDRLMVQSLIA
jgi:hypothetical protein